MITRHTIGRRLMLSCGVALPAVFGSISFGMAAPSELPFDMRAIAVREPTRAYLIAITRAAQRLVAVGEHGIIIFSDDNGKVWAQAKVPVDLTLTSVAFATPLVGWAAGAFGVILKTRDGGQSWARQLDGVQANQLILAKANAFAATHTGSQASLVASRRANIFVGNGPSIPFLCVSALDANNAVVFGAYRMAMRTTDGGKTWSDISLNVNDPISHNIYGVAVIGSDIYAVGETGLIFRSGDGGLSFPQISSPATGTLFGVLGLAGGRILVYGVAGQVFFSDNDGTTWSSSQTGVTGNVTAVSRLSSGMVLLVAEMGQLFLSKDNGVTFSPIPIVIYMQLNGVAEAQDGEIVLVGGSGIQLENIGLAS